MIFNYKIVLHLIPYLIQSMWASCLKATWSVDYRISFLFGFISRTQNITDCCLENLRPNQLFYKFFIGLG